MHSKVNSFAIRCLRDTGDQDYVAARISMAAKLFHPYLSSAEQAIEKYLKCILVLNRVDTKSIGHNIGRALDEVRHVLGGSLSLSDGEKEAFHSISSWDFDRYLLRSYHVFEHELSGLDHLVWRLRQYCEPLDVLSQNGTPSAAVFKKSIVRVSSVSPSSPVDGHLKDGLLEKILTNKRHASREGLVRENHFFSDNRVTQYSTHVEFYAINSPMTLEEDDVIAETSKWMKLR